MTKAEHYAEAERLAEEASKESYPEWVTARATLALVHATLASENAARRIEDRS